MTGFLWQVLARNRQSTTFSLYAGVCSAWALFCFVVSASLHSLVISICVFYFLTFCFELWAAAIAAALADTSPAEPPIGSRFSYTSSRFIVVAVYAIAVFIAFAALSVIVESIHSIFHAAHPPSPHAIGLLAVMSILVHSYRSIEARVPSIARLPPLAAFRPTSPNTLPSPPTHSTYATSTPNKPGRLARLAQRVSFPLLGLTFVVVSFLFASPSHPAVTSFVTNNRQFSEAVSAAGSSLKMFNIAPGAKGAADGSLPLTPTPIAASPPPFRVAEAAEVDASGGDSVAATAHSDGHVHVYAFSAPFFIVDTVGGLILAMVGLLVAIPTLRGAGGLLIQKFPTEVGPAILKALSEVAVVQGVVEVPYSEMHVWALLPGQVVMSLGVVIAPDSDAQHVRMCVRRILSPYVHTLTLALTPARRPTWAVRAHDVDSLHDGGGLALHAAH